MVKGFPGRRFMQFFYPGSQCTKDIIDWIEKEGIDCLDYTNLFDWNTISFIISTYDNHSLVFANEIIAENIAEDIWGKRISCWLRELTGKQDK